MVIKFLQWVAGFFQDQKNSASRKAAALYISLFFQYLIIQGNLEEKKVDDMVLYANTLIILFCLGAITAEFFKNSDLFKKE